MPSASTAAAKSGYIRKSVSQMPSPGSKTSMMPLSWVARLVARRWIGVCRPLHGFHRNESLPYIMMHLIFSHLPFSQKHGYQEVEIDGASEQMEHRFSVGLDRCSRVDLMQTARTPTSRRSHRHCVCVTSLAQFFIHPTLTN